ncbi:DNA-binding response regulator [Marinicauda salina]|uniref:DNA-binding response regulator n=1 Tax=Marinicauda salina TaxID=2135793 RepID=A0A2U2BUX9_9PROT|nr:response regulator transcription factor [Marinicauda salina]PWE17789.1 DNA-binding response regulator [Marinicauda salina]
MRILLIEDNRRMAELIAEGLERRGFGVDGAAGLAAADDHVAVTDYDAVVLDLGLPDGDGLEWLRALPADRAPVLILTARHTLSERVDGLDAGADDYLVKPAAIDEIAARLRAMLRRPGRRGPTVLTTGPVSLDPATREVRLSGAPMRLGRRETDLLELLMRRAGAVTPRETIEGALYGAEEAVTPNAVEAVASRLRRRLTEAGAGDMLHAVRGVGYYLGEPRP